MAEEGSYGVLLEFDALDYLISSRVDLIENAAAYDGIDGLVFALANGVDGPAGLEHRLGLARLLMLLGTATFHVRMVAS